MAPALKNAVIAITGDFGAKRATADLKRWVDAAGGELVTSISARVTHLVCSKEAWKSQNPLGTLRDSQDSFVMEAGNGTSEASLCWSSHNGCWAARKMEFTCSTGLDRL